MCINSGHDLAIAICFHQQAEHLNSIARSVWLSSLNMVQAKQRLQVENDGDVGTKYALDVAALGPHFAAFPASGFLAPNKQAQVEITFHPRAIHPDIRVDKVSQLMHLSSTLHPPQIPPPPPSLLT